MGVTLNNEKDISPDQGADGELQWEGRLRQLLVPVLQHLVEREGVDETGAYNFYNVRLQRGQIFTDAETALARELVKGRLDIKRVDEIGCGFGQLVFLLGWNGFQSIGFESERLRIRTATRLHAILDVVDHGLTANVKLLGAEFPSPDIPEPTSKSMVITTNLVATRSPPQQLQIVTAMRRYPFVLTDMQRLFEVRRQPRELDAGFALFAQAGFAKPELFLDLGNDGQYYLFRNLGHPS